MHKLQVNKRQTTVHTEELNHKSDSGTEVGDDINTMIELVHFLLIKCERIFNYNILTFNL